MEFHRYARTYFFQAKIKRTALFLYLKKKDYFCSENLFKKIMQPHIANNNYNLITEALNYSDKIMSENEIVQQALMEYIIRRKKSSIRDLKGQINFFDDYNYKLMRQ